MESKIIQYSLFKTLFDKTGNILECFYPFFLNSLINEKDMEALECQKQIKVIYDLDIPIHVLHRLALISNRKEHVKISNNKSIWPIHISEKGIKKKDFLLNPSDSERKINHLVSGFIEYLQSLDIIESHENVRTYIEAYIKKNLIKLSDYFFQNSNTENTCFEDHEKEFTQYILKIESESHDDYMTLKEMFLGSIISSSLKLPQKEFEGIIESKFKKTKVYFDANYLFSLLEYHDIELSTPAKELYHLLKKFGFELRYFDFTLSEMTHVLINYAKNYNQYPQGIKIHSLYSVLKRKGMSPSDVFDLISNLENKLSNLKIFKKQTGIDLEKFIPKDIEISNMLNELKPDQSKFYHNHDCAILEKASILRKKRIYNFEDANNFIITSDYKLGKICYRLFSHESDESISEIILDRTFTNILFLKDPSADLSLSTIISGFSSELFVKRSVWEKFYSILKDLKLSGQISDDKISNLFYHGYIEKELLNCEQTDIDDFNDDFVINKIEEATKIRDENVNNSINSIKEENQQIVISLEVEKQQELNAKDIMFYDKIDKMAKNSSNHLIIFLRFFIGFFLLVVPLIFEIKNFYMTQVFDTTIISLVRYVMYIFEICIISIPKFFDKIGNIFYLKRKGKLLKKLM
ncbi:MAG: hypothetical protein ACPKNR_03730 [Pleomorphochaeta sp.]